MFNTFVRSTILFLVWVLFSAQAEAMLRVGVLDSGFDKSIGTAPLCADSVPFSDSLDNKHGTNVAQLIADNAGQDGYCLVPIQIFNPEFDHATYIAALRLFQNLHIDVLNLSFAGSTYDDDEAKLIGRLIAQGTTVFAAAGNESRFLSRFECDTYPACADPRITVVGGDRESSNYGPRINIVAKQSIGCIRTFCLAGTSQATAIETGRYIKYIKEHRK